MATQNERDIASELVRRQRGDDEVPTSELHTYADGSQRFGVPPFPAKSPLEEEAESKAGTSPTPAAVPQGMKTSGEVAPAATGQITKDQFRAKVEQQVESDVLSGKSPDTPNPTTSSDKPELAGVAQVMEGLDPADPDDLKKLASGVKPDVKATQEQIDAAATQVAREVKGLVNDGKADKKAK